jgi:hypothetical protein
MSDIGLILNGFLGVLLIGALAVGWRLEGRLKALRASHLNFAKAVEDLDRAAARAEQGLADLRAATDEAAETLAGRIERAGALSAKLERLTAEAVNVEARMAPRPTLVPTPAREASVSRLADRLGRTPPPAGPPRGARADLILEEEPRRMSLADRLERLRGLAQPAGARSERDDDLFETPAPRRAVGGAR